LRRRKRGKFTGSSDISYLQIVDCGLGGVAFGSGWACVLAPQGRGDKGEFAEEVERDVGIVVAFVDCGEGENDFTAAVFKFRRIPFICVEDVAH
jgi:hypothetical protein